MLCIFTKFAWAQGELPEDEQIFYRDELSLSIGVRSNGFGLGTRYAKRLDALNKRVFEFQITSLHHDKEVKIAADLGGKLVYGKLNSTYQFLFSFGKQKEKYSKLDKGSVAIRYIHQMGFAFAFEKPYYYIVNSKGDEYEKFNGSNTSKNGKAPFIIGLDEIKVIPGIYITSAANFEFKKTDKIFRALEFGASIQAYPRKIQIMYSNQNTWIFPSLFITYRIGKILQD